MEKILEKLGFQALFDFENAFHAVEFAIEKGFKCVELNQTAPAFFPEKYSQVERQRLKNYLFPILIHAPEGLTLFNLHKKAMDGTLERIYEVIEFATDIGAKAITLHLGSTFTISVGNKMVWAHYVMAQQYTDALRRALLKIIEYTYRRSRVLKDEGCALPLICIENTAGFRYEISHPILADLLSHTNLCLTWDIGHTHILKLKGSDRSLNLHKHNANTHPPPFYTTGNNEEEFLLKFINKIKVVHLHDNRGEWDEHNIPGTGTVDFKHYFKLLDPIAPYYVIEVRPFQRALKSLEAIKKLAE